MDGFAKNTRSSSWLLAGWADILEHVFPPAKIVSLDSLVDAF